MPFLFHEQIWHDDSYLLFGKKNPQTIHLKEFNMSFQILFASKCCITNITFERLLSFVNWFSMPFKISFFQKNLHHKYHIWRASFLCELIQYALLDFLFQKNLHYKYYIWRASFLHERIQYAHSEFLCKKKALSQSLHLKGFFPLWTDSVCPFRFPLWEKLASQICIIFEGHLSFMDWFNLPIQGLFVRKCCITNITFERLQSSMN